MKTISILILMFFVLSVGILVSVSKYIVVTKKENKVSYAKLFIDMINTLKYKRDGLKNDYDVYYGELENKDTEEYIKYLDSGILDILGKVD